MGQGEELEHLHEKAINSGASKLYIEDLRQEFITEYVFPCLKAGAVYEGKYLLGTSFARPLIAKRLVEIAKKEGAEAIAHGATGKGNDQVRFELTVKALNPNLKIIAPWREWDLKSREDCIEYAQKRGIPLSVTKEKIYSRDRNLFHLSHEGGDLENPGNEPGYNELLQIITTPELAPDKPTYIEIEFAEGIPVKIDGKNLGPIELMNYVNQIAAANGVGICDMVENRLVGMKSRGVYETPGGTLLYFAHRELELLTLDRQTFHYKELLAQKYSEMVYDGVWFHPLKEALDAFVNSTQKTVTGKIKLKLYKGNIMPAGAFSPYSLYNEEFVTFGESAVYDQKDATGFINLFGLTMKVRALMEEKSGLKK